MLWVRSKAPGQGALHYTEEECSIRRIQNQNPSRTVVLKRSKWLLLDGLVGAVQASWYEQVGERLVSPHGTLGAATERFAVVWTAQVLLWECLQLEGAVSWIRQVSEG